MPRPTDPCWNYGIRLSGTRVQCKFCDRPYSSITEFKYHLAAVPKHGVKSCTEVPSDVAAVILRLIRTNRTNHLPNGESTSSATPATDVTAEILSTDVATQRKHPMTDNSSIRATRTRFIGETICQSSAQHLSISLAIDQHLHTTCAPVMLSSTSVAPQCTQNVPTLCFSPPTAVEHSRAVALGKRTQTSSHTNTTSARLDPIPVEYPYLPSSSTHTTIPAVALSDSSPTIPTVNQDLPSSSANPTLPVSTRHFLGPMDVKCPMCSALHWLDERLKESSVRNPTFGLCCINGKVQLPPLTPLPWPLFSLYNGNDARSRSFRENIHSYNMATAFTSLGTTFGPIDLSGRGPRSFTISGQLYHRIGPLQADQYQNATYAQLYIYDPDDALSIRTSRNPRCMRSVFQTIEDTLLQVNPFVGRLRQAHSILIGLPPELHDVHESLRYTASQDPRRYNLPTTNEIGVVLPGNGGDLGHSRNIILRLTHDNRLEHINECHPAYLPLHYVLLFPYGGYGWDQDMLLWDVKHGEQSTTRLSMMDFYCYRLFERPSEYSPILRASKLFQEFIVDA